MKSPAFQFYPADFLVGVMGLSDEEAGAYIKMLSVQWLKGPLPECSKEIKKLVGLGKKPSDFLLEKFPVGDCGKRKNERLEKEREKQVTFRESRAENAKKRWDKESTGNARASRSICKNDALRLQSSSSELKKVADAPELPFESERFKQSWGEWTSYRTQSKKKLSPISIKKQFNQFIQWGEVKSIQSINQSISHGWQGLFEPKRDTNSISQQEFKSSDVGI